MKLRPITVMVALLAVVALVAVVVARSGSDSTRVDQPAVLPLALGGVGSAAGSTSTVVPDLARLGRVTYVRGPGLADLGGTERAWSLASTPPDSATVSRLARAFGIDGQVVEGDGQLQVAGSDGRTLQVTVQPGTGWYLNGPPQAVTSTACAQTNGVVPDTTVPASEAPSGPVTTTTAVSPVPSSPPDQPTSRPVSPPGCVMPPAPVDVPDGPTAEAAARRLLTDAGIDLTHAQVTSVTSSWGTAVVVRAELDGVPVEGLDTTLDFGSHGVVLSASGWLGEPVQGDAYPLIGLDAGIARLQSGEGQLGITPLMETPDSPVTTVLAVPPATGAPEAPTTLAPVTSTTTTMVDVPGSMPETPTTPTVPMPTVVPGEPTPPQPQDTTVTITKAALVLAAVPGTDGSRWLVPAYHLESGDGGSWTVLAIDLAYVAPPPTVDPGVPSTGAGSTGSGGAMTPGSAVGGSGVVGGDPGAPTATCGVCHSALDGVNACCASASTTTSAGG